jgi:hypothetical protein
MGRQKRKRVGERQEVGELEEGGVGWGREKKETHKTKARHDKQRNLTKINKKIKTEMKNTRRPKQDKKARQALQDTTETQEKSNHDRWWEKSNPPRTSTWIWKDYTTARTNKKQTRTWLTGDLPQHNNDRTT